MQNRFVHLHILFLGLLLVLIQSPRARAGEVKPEVWFGGGGSWPDYSDVSEACVRAGIGAVFMEHFTLGVSGHGDKDHFHYFADGGVILPQVWFLVPYGRYQFGRRDDRDDNAWGWCAGIRLMGEGVNLYVEASEILEPEFNKALSLGLSF